MPAFSCQLRQSCGWGAIDTVEEVFAHAARSFTLRLAETLSQYICSLNRRAESLATPETECLLYATFWFRPILSELIGAAKESAEVNRKRALSGPVKVVVTNQPHSRFFFPPTPYGFRQVVQHVSKHVA